MILLKSAEQIAGMRAAGRVLVEARDYVSRMISPGVATADLNAVVEDVFRRQGAEAVLRTPGDPESFSHACCISVNEEAAHGVPGPRKLETGDIVTVDLACRLDRWCCDMAWTAAAGDTDAGGRQLIAAGQAVLDRVISELAGRKSWREVARAGVDEAARRGFAVVPGLSGHGIGRDLHEDPLVSWFPSVAGSAEDFALDVGLVFTVEPLVTEGYPRVRPSGNGWTLVTVDGARAVHFEHTVAVTASGIQVLTASGAAALDCP